MINFKINQVLINEVLNSKLINQGTFGIVYNYNGNAYKLYKKFITAIRRGRTIKKDTSDVYERMIRLINKQELIKLTELPLGIITYDDKLVGDIMPYYDKDKRFDKYTNHNYNIKGVIDKVEEAIYEMISQKIFYSDIYENNIMVERDGTPHIIDFDPEIISVDEDIDLKDYFNTIESDINYLRSKYNR